MEPDIQRALAEQQQKLDAIYQSVEKTRKYFLTTLIVSVVAFVLPLLGLMFAIPAFLRAISGLAEF